MTKSVLFLMHSSTTPSVRSTVSIILETFWDKLSTNKPTLSQDSARDRGAMESKILRTLLFDIKVFLTGLVRKLG